MQQNPFQKKKFLALPKKRQYKKIRDRLQGLFEELLVARDSKRALQQADELLLLLSFRAPFSEPCLALLQESLQELLDASNKASAANFLPGPGPKPCHDFAPSLEMPCLRGLYDSYLLLSRRTGFGPSSHIVRLLQESAFSHGNMAVSKIPFRFCLWNLRSAHNAGSILRSLDCFGLEGAILAGYTPGPEAKGFQAAAMHTESWMAIERIPADFSVLTKLLRPGQKIFALETSPLAISLKNFSFPEKGGIILAGNEELGLPRELLERVDACIAIPMYGKKASLNVSNACAVLAYAVRLGAANTAYS